MRPYLAVLKDSFREAMASRVLWFALAAIALVLLALAPFSLAKTSATQLRTRELRDPDRLVRVLTEHDADESPPAAHIWSLLSTDQRETLSELIKPPGGQRRGPGRGRSAQRTLVRILNELLKRDDFYNEAAWHDVALDDDLTAAIRTPATDEDARAATNLRLLAAAFPRAIRIRDSTEVSINYAGRNVVGPLPLPPSQLGPAVDRILVIVVSWFLGFFGVLASLLVTAAVIPRTFEPGEISLLLSKPVHRAALFLTKFAGGCIFTLLCATALVGGVWLLLGFRFGMWEHRLLACIPVYVFVFAVFFSVSANMGLIWRNAIVSLVLVVVFWLFLTVLGVVKTALDQNLFKPSSITEIIPAGERLFAVNGSRQVLLYNSATREWERKFARDMQGMPAMVQRFLFAGMRFRPTFDERTQRLLAIEQVPSRFGGLGRGKVVVGREENDWEREPEAETPDTARDIYVDPRGRVIVPCRTGVYEFVGQTDSERQTQEFFSNVLGGLLTGSNKKAFRKISGDEVPAWAATFVTAIHPTDGSLLVYDDGQLHRLEPDETGSYQAATAHDFETDENAVFSVGGDRVTIAFGDGLIRILRKDDLSTIATHHLPEGLLPRVSATSHDGLLAAVLTHDGSLLLFDHDGNRHSWKPPEDGHASAVTFDASGTLYVANGRQDVRAYRPGETGVLQAWTVDGDWVTRLYDWGINPAYSLLPRPGEIDNFVNFLLTGARSESIVSGGPGALQQTNLEEDRITFDPWKPLLSNLAFLIVMLAFGCFYVSRKDF